MAKTPSDEICRLAQGRWKGNFWGFPGIHCIMFMAWNRCVWHKITK